MEAAVPARRPASPAPPEARRADARTRAWEVLLRGRPRAGEVLRSERWGTRGRWRAGEPFGDGRWLVRSHGRAPVPSCSTRHGATPLPPYIQARAGRPRALPDHLTPPARARRRRPPPACTSRRARRRLRRRRRRILEHSRCTSVWAPSSRWPRRRSRTRRLHSEAYEVDGRARGRACGGARRAAAASSPSARPWCACSRRWRGALRRTRRRCRHGAGVDVLRGDDQPVHLARLRVPRSSTA